MSALDRLIKEMVGNVSSNSSSKDLNEALSMAASRGFIPEIRRLLPLCDPKHDNSKALCNAASMGQLEAVNILLPLSDATANNSRALLEATFNGNVECVKALIPVSDPKADNSMALQNALYHRHFDCALALAPHSDVPLVLKNLNGKNPEAVVVLEKWMNEEQRKVINTAVGVNNNPSSVARKM